MATFEQLKEVADGLFKAGDNASAADKYTALLNMKGLSSEVRGTLYR